MNPRFHYQATVARPLRRSPSDARLVELARNGSEPAFEAIVARYRLPLVRHCARLVGEADAEDAAQDALVNAHAALLRGAAVRQLAPWLYAIAQNAARSCLRARAACPSSLSCDGRSAGQVEPMPSAGQPCRVPASWAPRCASSR